MEGSESSLNRIGRTIWTVWGYLSGAVGRYLKPEDSNEDKQNGEDAGADVTISKSYRELKESEEEKERRETNTSAQSESAQSGVRVRLAAVQWEKASIRKGATYRHSGTGVAWNTGVQEGRKEGINRKAEEERDGVEASDNNNEAVTAKSTGNDFVEEAFVDAPFSIDASKAAQDFGNSGSVEMGIDAERSEPMISNNAEKAAMKNENAAKGDNVTEALDKKGIEHTKDQDESEKKEVEQRTNQRMTEREDEAYTSQIADNLLSQLTYSTKQMEDLFGTPSHKELKVDGKHSETTGTTESKSEREVIETTVEETKQRTKGTIEDEQDESILMLHDVVDYELNLEEAKIKVNEGGVATGCELLEEAGTAQDENREKEIIEQELEPVNKDVLTPGKEDTNDETIQEIVGTIKDINDGQHQAGHQLIPEKLNICELKQDMEAQFGLTEGIVEMGKELEPVCTVTEYEAIIITAETEATKAIEESKQVTVGTLKEGHHEAGLESIEFESPEIVDKLEIHESKQDESQTVYTEEMVRTECEALEEPATGQMEDVEIYGNEPESFCKGTENDPVSVIEETKWVTFETTEDEQQEAKQFSESKFAEAVDLCESKLDESPVQFTEERAKTESDLLEEPVTGHMEEAETHGKDLELSSQVTENEAEQTVERESNRVLEESEQTIVGTRKEGQHNVGPESSEFIDSEIADEPDIHNLKLDENQTVFTEEMVETECEPLEEPAAGQMEIAEIYGKEPEPISESTENEARPTTQIEPDNVIKQSNQVTLGATEDEQQEAKQFSESKFAESVDLCESKLDESHVQFTEEREKIESDLLEDPMTGHMEVAETHGKDLEPSCKGTGNEAEQTLERKLTRVLLEESEQAIVGTRKEGQHKASFESSEFIDSEIADTPDIHMSKLDENQTVFTEEMAETQERVKSECDLLVEHVTGHMEVKERHDKDLEPSSKGTEDAAALLPDSEAISSFLVAPTQGIVVTGKSEQSEADQLQLLGEFIGSDITEKMDIHGAKTHETQSEFTAGMVETECKASRKVPLMMMTFNDESVDYRAVGAIVKEADQLHQPEENSKAGTTSDVALKTEKELFGDTIRDIYRSQITEVVIKQDSESVIALVTEGPRNQSETTEFQQEVRAEVAADVVKKSAEMEHVHEQPKSSEHLALQENMPLSILEHKSDKKVNELQLPEEQISHMQRETIEMESDSAENAEETAVKSVDKMSSSSPQELDKCEDSMVVGVELLTGLTPETKASFTAQKVEVLEVNTELTAVSERVVTEAKCEKAAFETGASETESESNLAAVEAPEKFRRSEASDSDETFGGGQSLLKQEEWTVQDRSAVEPHGHQMGYSGELSLPESELALETSEMQTDSDKGGSEDIESPDEADSGLLYEKQVMMSSLGVVEEVMRSLKQEFEEKESLSSREMDTHEKGLTKTLEECVETSDPNLNPSNTILQTHSDLSDNTVEIRQNLPGEAMDIGSEKERKEEVGQNTTGDDTEFLADGEEDIGVKEEKADDEEKSVVDSNGNWQERSRPGLKRGFEKMARNEESKPTVPKDWAGTGLVLQQVSSLDCTVQKSKIALKNPHVRPPKDPRTLINKASVEPLAPTRPSQPIPLRKAQGEGLIIPQKGVQGIGFKLPGLGAGFPALRKTDAGKKIRDEGETESTSTESLPVQKSDTQTESQEDSVKPQQPANKPKWTPPRHPGMGNPMMMSELKNKLRKTGKE